MENNDHRLDGLLWAPRDLVPLGMLIHLSPVLGILFYVAVKGGFQISCWSCFFFNCSDQSNVMILSALHSWGGYAF